MEKHLHIITLNVPYPVDYGGVFDLFYKLPALQAQGVKIHLHCFEYGRGEQEELNKYCASVNYYKRQEGHKGISSRFPYIVASRKNELLFNNLLNDDYPIFMEGIHCTYLLADPRFAGRKKFVRVHNVEYQYYHELFHHASSPLKKIYYYWESRLLKKYEQSIVSKATAFWGVTEKDVAVYRNELGCKTIDYLPLYLPPNWEVNCLEGIGHFCLYQADLSVDVNEQAAIWLIQEVFSKIKVPLVITGKKPSKKLEELAHEQKHTCLVANPDEKEMQEMIAKAHINILPSYHSSGIKLKLLNALYNGRHCLVNEATVVGSGLEAACHIGSNANVFANIVLQLKNQPFTTEEITLRKKILAGMFNNEANAKQQVKWIFG
ncbi:glycosyltransferase [Parasediminibacterium sp. JCM 36343]|uniref:glycosyltransferase n=1 Tax=Parasediminibacterium sp. JCM 36343 TaxID=3374279 RepID=UPI0039791012